MILNLSEFEALQKSGGNFIVDDDTGKPVLELIHKIYFHKKALGSTNAKQTLKFFDANSNATPNDTNLLKNEIPDPNIFLLYGITLRYVSTATFADVKNFEDGAVIFFKATRDYLEGLPVDLVPTSGGLYGFAATEGGSDAISDAVNYFTKHIPEPNKFYDMRVNGTPIILRHGVQFHWRIEIEAAAAFSAQPVVMLRMHGVEARGL